MRPISPRLVERLRCADPSARIIVEAQIEQRRDVRQRKDQWQAADLVVLRSADFPAGNSVTAVNGTTEVTLANAPAANDLYEIHYKVTITPIVPGAGTNTHELVVAVETDLTGGGTWTEQFQFIYTLKRKAGESASAVTWKVERALIRVTGITSTGKVRLKAKSFTAPGGASFTIHGFNLATDADPLSGVKYHTGPKLDFLDDGVSLGGAIVTKISNAVSDGFETDFGGPPTTLTTQDSILCARIIWGKDDSPDIAIDRITAFLHPKKEVLQAKNVAFWVCQPWALRKNSSSNVLRSIVDLIPLCPPVVVQAGEGTAAGDITFSFFERTYQLPWGPVVIGRKPRPKSIVPEFVTPPTFVASDYDSSPTTFLFIWGVQADGAAATNIGWGRDSATTSITNGSRKLRTVTIKHESSDVISATDGPGGVLRLKIETGTYTSETLAFTGAGNQMDLGAAPTDAIELIGLADVLAGTSATFQVRNDADTAWVTYTEGQTFADLGLTQTQTRKLQCLLAPNTEADATPIVRAMGMRDLKRSRSETATVRRYVASMDPVTLRARQPEAVITAIRDGERDFRDWITEFLSDNFLTKIAFRVFVGDPSRSRAEWLHLDDFRIEDYDPQAAEIEIQCVSALEFLKRALPKYNTTTQKREPLAYANKTPKQVFDDILGVQLSIADRYRGHGLEDESALIAKTITDSDGKTEVDAVAHIAGAVVSTSQGKIQAFPFFGPGAVRAVFPSAEIELVSITPGFRQRIPEFHARYNWDDIEQRFRKEVRVEHGNALLNLDIVGLDPPRTLEDEIARWIPDDEALAKRVAERRVNTLGTGLIYMRFRSIYAYPELELGDIVAIETDQFVARDPNVARALRGQLWVTARIAESTDALGTEFGAWIQSYADIFGASEAGQRLGFAVPEIIESGLTVADSGVVSAVFKCRDAKSLKFASSTSAFPTKATVQAAGSNALDAEGILTVGSVATLTDGQTLFVSALAYEAAGAAGSESTLAQARITFRNVPTVSIIGARAIWRANRLFVSYDGNTGVLSVRIATSTASYPAAGTGTIVEGQDGLFDAGTFVYGNTVFITITPYPNAAAGGTTGPIWHLRARLSYLDLLLEELSGKLIRSTSYSDTNFALKATDTLGETAAAAVKDSRALGLNTMFGKTVDGLDEVNDDVAFKKVTGVSAGNQIQTASIVNEAVTNLKLGAALFVDFNKSTTSTAEVSLTSFSLPAGTLGTNGQRLRLTIDGQAVTQECATKFKFGAVSVGGNTAIAAGRSFRSVITVTRTGAATQIALELGTIGDGTAANFQGFLFRTAPTETLSDAILIDFRGNVVSGGTLKFDQVMVEYLAV